MRSLAQSFRHRDLGTPSAAVRAGKAILRHGLAPLLYRAGAPIVSRSVRRRARRGGRLLILVYHRVIDPEPQRLQFLSETLAVSIRHFDAQMAYLSQHYKVQSLETALRNLRESGSLATDAVAITFDDGYRDNLTNALPALRRYGLPATIFVATDHIGTGALTWFDRLVPLLTGLDLPMLRQRSGKTIPAEIDRLVEMYLCAPVRRRKLLINLLSEALKHLSEPHKQEILAAFAASAAAPDFGRPIDTQDEPLMLNWTEIRGMTERGIAFGSHTCSHPILTRVSRGELEREVTESKRVIEAHLGRPCGLFAYPNGRREDCPDGVGDLLMRHGYTAACASQPGLNHAATDPMMLRRLSIGNYPVALFALVLESWFTFGRAS